MLKVKRERLCWKPSIFLRIFLTFLLHPWQSTFTLRTQVCGERWRERKLRNLPHRNSKQRDSKMKGSTLNNLYIGDWKVGLSLIIWHNSGDQLLCLLLIVSRKRILHLLCGNASACLFHLVRNSLHFSPHWDQLHHALIMRERRGRGFGFDQCHSFCVSWKRWKYDCFLQTQAERERERQRGKVEEEYTISLWRSNQSRILGSWFGFGLFQEAYMFCSENCSLQICSATSTPTLISFFYF